MLSRLSHQSHQASIVQRASAVLQNLSYGSANNEAKPEVSCICRACRVTFYVTLISIDSARLCRPHTSVGNDHMGKHVKDAS